jgi:hypothetical protein
MRMSDFWEGIRKDKFVISWLLLIIMFISYLFPLGIPISIRDPTRNVFNFIESLPEDGKPLLLSLDYTAGGQTEIKPGMIAVVKHLMDNNQKFVIVGIGTDESTALMQSLINELDLESRYDYGVDYVGIGFIPGGEITVASLAEDFQNVIETDAYGNKVSDLQLTADIEGVEDFAAMIPFDSAGVMMFWVRNWTTYDIPFFAAFTAGSEPTYAAFYNAGDIEGYLAGLRGGAEYELLTGYLSLGVKSMDLQSLTHLYAFAVLVVGNIVIYIRRNDD